MSASPDEKPPLVSGEVVIKAGTPALHGAAVYVWLEDVSRADGKAERVAETVLRDVHHQPPAESQEHKGTSLPFALHASPSVIDPRNDYTVRVWVDSDGDGKQGPGDLYSDQSYPVLTRGAGQALTILLGPSTQTLKSDNHGAQ